MSSSPAIRKLRKEYASLEAEPVFNGVTVRPLESNLLHTHFLLAGSIFWDTPYEGGVYHGVLQFPKEYPFRPPTIRMRTPSNRFRVNDAICFSMSDFHPESWQPAWNIRTILIGFVSFMNGDEITAGGIEMSSEGRIRLAKESLGHCQTQDILAKKIFGDVLQSMQEGRTQGEAQWPPTRPAQPVDPTPKASIAPSSLPSPAPAPPAAEPGTGTQSAKNKKKREKEKRKKLANKFLAELRTDVPEFLANVHQELTRKGVAVSDLTADHVCYRTDTLETYQSLVGALGSSSQVELLIESRVGGRQIATYRLVQPNDGNRSSNCPNPIASADGIHSVHVIEIPSPKEGRPYERGLEHVEYVLENDDNSDDNTQTILKAWMDKYPSVDWSTRAIDKEFNPDVSMQIEIQGRPTSVKFHTMTLEDVIEAEKQ